MAPSDTDDYEEAVAALRALKSLFEQELERRKEAREVADQMRGDDSV